MSWDILPKSNLQYFLQKLKGKFDLKADADDVEGTQTVSGNPITLTDASETYVQALSVELEPQQDLHGQSAPYVGGAWKNKFGIEFIENNDFTLESGWYRSNVPICKAGTYKWTGISFSSSVSGLSVRLNDLAGNISYLVNSSSIVPTFGNTYTDDVYLEINYTKSGFLSALTEFEGQLEEGSTATTFAPYSNICPISGYEGVEVEDVGFNQWDEEWEVGAIVSDGSVDVTQVYRWTTSLIKIQPNTTYYQVCPNSALQGRYAYYDSNGNLLEYNSNGFGSHLFTTPQDAYGLRITFGINYGTIYNHDISINYPSTDTNYHPYQSRTASVTFGQTVYSGSVDVTNGGTDDEFENLDDFTDIAFHANQGGTYAYEVYIGTPDKKYGVDNLLASLVPVKTSFTDVAEFSIRGFGNDSDIAIKFPKSVVNTPELAKQWCIDNGLQIVYEKATPTTISTPPTDLKLLKGTNNITTNGTTINLGYQPDNVIGDAVKASEQYTDRVLAGIISSIPAKTSDLTNDSGFLATSDMGEIVSFIEDSMTYSGETIYLKACKFKNGMKFIYISCYNFPKYDSGSSIGISGFLTSEFYPSINNSTIQGVVVDLLAFDNSHNPFRVSIGGSNGTIYIHSGAKDDGIELNAVYM